MPALPASSEGPAKRDRELASLPVPRIDLARVVDLAVQLESDAGVDPGTLRRRDRTVGRELSGRMADATARVEAWLDRVARAGGPSAGERAERAQRVLRAVLVGLGLLAGCAAALAVFAYEGRHPVNVVQAVAVFVGLQALSLVATGVLALPTSWRRRVPGLTALQDVLALASPGRWQPLLRRVLPPGERDALDRALGLARRHQRLYGDVQKWALLVASQGFAVAFNVAAVATLVGLVTFSDLAFGWSTTLDVDVERLHAIARALALPWASWLPDAAPTPGLIRETQYFRGVPGGAIDPVASAPWWRFLVACLVCYGLAPRGAVLGLAVWRQQTALRRAFRHLPGAADLRDRLESRQVETAAPEAEVAAPQPARAARDRDAPLAPPARVQVVCWSGVPVDAERAAALVGEILGAEATRVLDGGAGSGRDDAELVGLLAAGEGAPALLVKAWEPPLLEVVDLLAALREALGEGVALWVLPLAEDGSGGPVLADPEAARAWRRRLDAVGDPWLAVRTREEAA